MKRGGFLKSNWSYLIWFGFYFTITMSIVRFFTSTTAQAFLISAILYGISVAYSLSPIGESIIRRKTGAEPVKTLMDRNKLIPIFEEVYASAVEMFPRISRHIQIYVIEDRNVNAFATGRHTIAVTRGAMELGDNELKGIIAHEFGHLAHGDTNGLSKI